MSDKFSPEQWQDIEQNVNEAEKVERKRKLADAELEQETNLTKDDRENFIYSPIEIALELQNEKQSLIQEVDQLLGAASSPERALVALQRQNLFKALREKRKLELEQKALLEKEVSILEKINQAQESGKPTRGKNSILEKIRLRLSNLKEEQENLLQSTPEAYFGLHLKELKEYKNNLKEGKLIETPYVKEKAEDIAVHLRAGKPVMIYGHLGTGKTELAMHVARNYLGKEALVISGSKHTSLAELYGHQVLKVDEATGATVSDFFLGPIYRAMQEGRPVIIDEVNAIPHEVLISLNHILTRKVGDKITVQQNSGSEVEIQEGFGIIMTGNLNQGQEKYIDRQDMDPAFLSRLYKLEYDYLPQKTEGTLEDEAGSDNELFHLLLARIMDRTGNAEIPKDSMKKLWNLAKAARVIENVFAGREVNTAFYFQQAGGRSTKYLLKESVLSIRAIDAILTQWQKEGYRYELDYYLYKEFIAQGTVASDKAYLYQQLKDRFSFFTGNGWEQNPNYGTAGNIQAFDIKAPRNESADLEFMGPRELVQLAYGASPERAKWPEISQKESQEPEADLLNIEEFRNLEEFKLAIEKDLEEVRKEIREVCEI